MRDVRVCCAEGSRRSVRSERGCVCARVRERMPAHTPAVLAKRFMLMLRARARGLWLTFFGRTKCATCTPPRKAFAEIGTRIGTTRRWVFFLRFRSLKSELARSLRVLGDVMLCHKITAAKARPHHDGQRRKKSVDASYTFESIHRAREKHASRSQMCSVIETSARSAQI